MQYLLSVVHDEDSGWEMPPDVMQELYKTVGAFNEELQAAGAWVFGGGLNPNKDAKVFEYKNGDVAVTDGPFAETKEQVGGFWVIKADNDEAAREWTRKASIACQGRVELRTFQPEG